MVKAEQHDTDRAGRLIFMEVFYQLNWIPNQISEDYGIDYNVQAFNQKEPTGAWFQVQLKSSLSLAKVGGDQFISYSLDLDHLSHYAQECKQPVFLILVDVSSREVYWTCPLLELAAIRDAQMEGSKSLSLRIPSSQTLPGSAGEFIETLSKAYLILAARELSETSAASFDEALRKALIDDVTLQGMQEKQDQIRLLRAAEAFNQGRREEAEKRIHGILDDLDATLIGKFNALAQQNAVEFHKSVHAGSQSIDLANVNFAYAKNLRKLAGRDHLWIRFAATLVHATARVERAVQLDAADFMALKVHSQAAVNPIATIGLLARRAANAREIIRLYNRALELLKSLDPPRGVLRLGRFVTRIATSICPYLVSLEYSSNLETAKQFIKSALHVLDLSVEISLAASDTQGVGISILAGLTLAHREDSDPYRWADETRKKIQDPQIRADIEELITETRRRWLGETISGDYNPDPIWQIYQKLARSAGIDISDEKSLLVRKLRIAAADDTPEPWMKFCTAVVMSNGAVSPVDLFIQRNFGIKTSPNKIAHCKMFDLHYEGIDGAQAFEKLRSMHCDSCSLRIPRAASWELTNEGLRQANDESAAFLEHAESRGYGARFVERDALDH